MELDQLHIVQTNATDLPTLQTRRIRSVNASKNGIRTLWNSSMPAGIEELNLEENALYSDGLLEIWPPTLRVLKLSRNPFTRIQPEIQFPESLRILHLHHLAISTLPPLPEGLEELDISATDIKVLETLPLSLLRLNASGTFLKRLPRAMPPGIQEVDVSYSKLKAPCSLPTNWGTALVALRLSRNRLTEWPRGLPPTLQELNLAENKILQVPDELPPGLLSLNVSGNHILTLPPRIGRTPLPMILASENCLVQIPKLETHPGFLSLEHQWTTRFHTGAAKLVQKLWARYRMRRRLRAIRRMALVREPLLEMAMHPDRAGQFEDISPGWTT